MSQFAVAATVAPRDEAPAQAWRAPTTFFDAVSANADASFNVYRAGAREEAARADEWRAHLQAEKNLGKVLPRSQFMMSGSEILIPGSAEFIDTSDPTGERAWAEAGDLRPSDIGGLDQAAYDKRMDKLRQENPAAMANVPTRQQQAKARDARLRATAQRAAETGEDHPVGAFVGGAAGTMADPVNLAATVMTGPLGAGRGLLTRMAIQGAVNASVEAGQQPFKAIEADRYGGPEWTPGQAAFDIGAAGAGAAGFELGGDLLGKALRRFLPRPGTPELRAAQLLDDVHLTDRAIGDVGGEVYNVAAHALDRGENPLHAVLRAADDLEPPPRFQMAATDVVENGRPAFFLQPDDATRARYRLGADDQIFGWTEDGVLRIERSELSPAARGQGLGVAMYQAAAREAAAGGRVLASDSTVSASAQQVWSALERRGYAVERNASAVAGADGALSTPDGSAVFTLSPVSPRAQVETELVRQLGADLVEPIIRQGDAFEAEGGGLAREPAEAAAALNRVALSVLDREGAPTAQPLREALAKVKAGEPVAEVVKPLVQAVRRQARRLQAADAVRGASIDPAAPSPAARAVVDGFDDPHGLAVEKLAAEKPEAADAEPPPGLFDDLPEVGIYERAHAALRQCAVP